MVGDDTLADATLGNTALVVAPVVYDNDGIATTILASDFASLDMVCAEDGISVADGLVDFFTAYDSDIWDTAPGLAFGSTGFYYPSSMTVESFGPTEMRTTLV